MKNNYHHLKLQTTRLILLFFVSSLFWACSTGKMNTALIPTDKLQQTWWQQRHEKVLDSLSTNPQLLLIGNSILHSLDDGDRKDVWEKYLDQYNAVNMGFSGDRTENVIWRLENGELENIHPKVAVLLIGTNNTDGNNYPTINMSNELEAATWKICQIIREKLPDTQILLLGILPFGRNMPNYRNSINQKTSELVSTFPARDKNIHYVDIGDIYLDADGNIIKDLMPDFLHPNAAGHLLMFETLQPHIEKLMP